MLVTTSLVYVLLYGTAAVIYTVRLLLRARTLIPVVAVAKALSRLVFAYNFYVYLITGKQFRSELRKLFCRFCSSSNAVDVAGNDARVTRRGEANNAV